MNFLRRGSKQFIDEMQLLVDGLNQTVDELTDKISFYEQHKEQKYFYAVEVYDPKVQRWYVVPYHGYFTEGAAQRAADDYREHDKEHKRYTVIRFTVREEHL